MENEIKSLTSEDYLSIKELFISREKQIKYKLDKIQNGIVNFCRDYTSYQNKDNFFNLTIKEQFEFNECIEYTGNKIKKDFREIETFYSNCKTNCLKIFKHKSEEIIDTIDQYNQSQTDLMRPSLHPCIKECIDIFHYTSDKYFKYMFLDSGLYIELIDFKKNIV